VKSLPCCNSKQQQQQQDTATATSVTAPQHLVVKELKPQYYSEHDDDDDTASTVTETSVETDEDEELEDSIGYQPEALPQKRSVTFVSPIVTSVRYIPKATQEDKYYLWYSEYDYVDFKLEYYHPSSRLVKRTPRRVGFAREVVTDVKEIPALEAGLVSKMYYTSQELQSFLDEFVLSLQRRMS
jgi:hypothetical protein